MVSIVLILVIIASVLFILVLRTRLRMKSQQVESARQMLALEENDLPDTSEAVSKTIYRIVEELFNNASKHAPGCGILISMEADNRHLILKYNDDGPGFIMDEAGHKGIGLKNIMAIASLAGGKAECQSTPGDGTEWVISITLKKKQKKLHDTCFLH